MFAEFMNLGMAVMTARDTIVRAGFLYLFILQTAKFQALLLETGLEKATAPAAAIIIGSVGLHINKIFFSNDRFDNISQIFGNRIPIRLTHDLTGILDRKFDL
jgi:hypothetical protein